MVFWKYIKLPRFPEASKRSRSSGGLSALGGASAPSPLKICIANCFNSLSSPTLNLISFISLSTPDNRPECLKIRVPSAWSVALYSVEREPFSFSCTESDTCAFPSNTIGRDCLRRTSMGIRNRWR